MALISPERLEIERKKHNRKGPQGPHQLEGYGVSGWRWASDVRRYADRMGVKTILDYGAGKGTLSERLANVSNYDPITFPGDPEPADMVVCTDVLEFVEDHHDVLSHIQSLARKVVYIAVPKHPNDKASPDLLIREPMWWERLLAVYWPNYEADIVSATRYGVMEWREGDTPRLRFVGRC